MNDGRFDDAARIYRDLLQALPDEAPLLMNLGMALAMGGHEPEAIAPLERAIAINPKLFPAHLFLGSSYLALGQPQKAIGPLKQVVSARPADVEHRRSLAQAYAEAGRPAEAVTELRRVTELAPTLPAGWYALGHAYNALAQDALADFDDRPQHAGWRQVLLADALTADGRLVDAFATYRETFETMPALVSIHDSIGRIYEQTGHPEWAAIERGKGRLTPAECVKRKALCEFRAGRYRAALAAASGSDPESRYWRVRAATELTKEAFNRLDRLPDSRERREVRAALATADRRYPDAVTELRAAQKYAPADPALLGQLGTALYLTRDYEQAVAVLGPLVNAVPPLEDPKVLTAYGDSLLQLDRVDDAVPVLRRAFTADSSDREANLALARALMRQRQFGAALPLLEWQLASDTDGSVHVLLSRALAGLGQTDKAEAMLAKSQEIQRAAQQRAEEAGKRVITPPK